MNHPRGTDACFSRLQYHRNNFITLGQNWMCEFRGLVREEPGHREWPTGGLVVNSAESASPGGDASSCAPRALSDSGGFWALRNTCSAGLGNLATVARPRLWSAPLRAAVHRRAPGPVRFGGMLPAHLVGSCHHCALEAITPLLIRRRSVGNHTTFGAGRNHEELHGSLLSCATHIRISSRCTVVLISSLFQTHTLNSFKSLPQAHHLYNHHYHYHLHTQPTKEHLVPITSTSAKMVAAAMPHPVKVSGASAK